MPFMTLKQVNAALASAAPADTSRTKLQKVS